MRRLATVLLSLLMLSLVSCLGGSGDQSADTSAPSRVVMAVTADPDGLDPHMSAAASTFQVTSSIYETLVTVDAQGHIIPGLAESWQVADDGLSITFTLAEGVLFSNGDPCDAEAVKASFDRLCSSESVRSGDYAFISGVEVLDGRTVRFTFDSVNVLALTSFAYPWAAVVDVASSGSLRTNPVGSGPYMLSSWVPQQSLVLKRNPNWRDECQIEEVEFRLIGDMTSQVAALQSGQVDIILITGDLVGQFEGRDGYTIDAAAGNGLQLMAMNTARPGLDDVRVRQAINHAVDKDALIEAVWWGYGEKIGSHFPTVLSEYVDMNGKYPYDPQRARTLLAEAGYGEGELKLTMYLPRSYQEYVNAGQVIAAQLEAVGIDIDIQIVEWATWLSDIYTGRNYDLTVVGHTGRLDAYSLLSRYRSTASENYFNYSDEEMDSLLDAYVDEVDEQERTAIAHRMQQILAEDVPALYIQDPIQIYVLDSSLQGFEVFPINIFKFQNMSFVE